MSRLQRLELLVFVSCFFAFAYFNQGGGWNQNARFAEVRALVEQGRFAIDDYLIYERQEGTEELERIPVDHAQYTLHGERYHLCWVDMEWNMFPIGAEEIAPGVKKSAMVSACASGDIGYVPETGHFHPNKPPGTSLLAVPGYFLIYHLEKMLGVNPDHWWTLDLNGWLASVCSVGLISALGCVIFFRLARQLAGGETVPALVATFAFAFGTTFFPFGTLLFDHDLTASFLVMAFYFLYRSRETASAGQAVLAGVLAGAAVLTNYVAIGGVAVLGIFALLAQRESGQLAWRRAISFSLGGLGPFLVLCLSSWLCYGSPLKPGTDFQSPLFRDSSAFLGMFAIPRNFTDWYMVFYHAALLSVSPFRGMFWFSPILLGGLYGLFIWMRRGRKAEAAVCLGIAGFFFVVNCLFNGYHAGFAAGPRYLIPGLPFLALPVIVAFARWPKSTSALAVLSIGINLLLTATDAQNPVGVGGHARTKYREEFHYDLIGEYAWPLFVRGQAWPLLQDELNEEVEKNRKRLWDEADGDPKAAREREAALRADLQQSIERGDQSPFLLASIRGPVSVNPLGVYEGLFEYRLFPPGSQQCRRASFNIGEFFFPDSRWSILPLLLISGGAAAWSLFFARRWGRATG